MIMSTFLTSGGAGEGGGGGGGGGGGAGAGVPPALIQLPG